MEESFSSIIFSDPNVEFNVNQKSAITNINDFIYSSGQNICVLKGFAGTGKTYIVSRVVKNLWKIKKTRDFIGSYRQICKSFIFLL